MEKVGTSEAEDRNTVHSTKRYSKKRETAHLQESK
jgi:hypothetical protein